MKFKEMRGLKEYAKERSLARGTSGGRRSGRSGQKLERPPDFKHHYQEDLACPACGTDSSVGCFADPLVGVRIPKDRR